MQFLLNCHPLGLPESDFGPLGLSAAEEDPPAKVLPDSQCHFLPLARGMERTALHVVGQDHAHDGMKQGPGLTAALASSFTRAGDIWPFKRSLD